MKETAESSGEEDRTERQAEPVKVAVNAGKGKSEVQE